MGAFALALSAGVLAQQSILPNKAGSVKFAVIGDSGTGDQNQYRLAEKLVGFRNAFPYEFVLMMGDNSYGGESAKDFEQRFEIPYKPLLDAGLKFYAALGNHDTPNQRLYKPFNMSGDRFYTFRPKLGVRFFALDSNYMSKEQLAWLEKELAASGSEWKICFFHHPLYSSGGTHGSDQALRDQLEPLFLKHGVNVVLSGHDHFYERVKPQKGINYFVSGGSAKVRKGDIEKTDLTAKGFDQGYHFMAIEIAGDEFHFQVVSDKGETVDSGVIKRQAKPTM
jgi:hypothetical protein